jgi:hypothetical protein
MLSRLWYAIFAVALGVALTAALLNKSAASREANYQLGEQLRRDRVETELWLRLDARLRLDALAPFTTNSVVRQTLRSSSRRSKGAPESARRRLSQELHELNDQLEEGKADLLFAIDNDGQVVADLDKTDLSQHDLGQMPLVADALSGYLRDDVWIYNGEIYRMVARPVFDGARYVGAIVHGIKIDDSLAQRLGKKLPNSTIAFFFRDDLIAMHRGASEAPTRSELSSGFKSFGPEHDPDEAITLDDGKSALFVPIRGSAAHAGVGYIIGRHRSPVGAGALFSNTYQEDIDAMPWPAVVGIPLAMLLLGLLWMYLEHGKAIRILRRTSAALARNELTSLPADKLRRQYRKIAENINAGLRSGVGLQEGGQRHASVNLDEMLSRSRDEAAGSYFGFPNEEPTTRRHLPLNANGHSAAVEEKSVLELTTVAQTPAAKVPTRPAPMAKPEIPGSRPLDDVVARTRPIAQAPAATALRDPLTDQATSPGSIIDQYSEFDSEESTTVANIPDEIMGAASADNEEIHFRQVFNQFVKTQQQCGGSISGLTFERFVRKLRATRDQVMKRHSASSVRFTVYVKEGRAALKASPVKQ